VFATGLPPGRKVNLKSESHRIGLSVRMGGERSACTCCEVLAQMRSVGLGRALHTCCEKLAGARQDAESGGRTRHRYARSLDVRHADTAVGGAVLN